MELWTLKWAKIQGQPTCMVNLGHSMVMDVTVNIIMGSTWWEADGNMSAASNNPTDSDLRNKDIIIFLTKAYTFFRFISFFIEFWASHVVLVVKKHPPL